MASTGTPGFAVTLTDLLARSVCAAPTQATLEASRLTELSQLPQHMWLTVAFSVGAARTGATVTSVSAAHRRISLRILPPPLVDVPKVRTPAPRRRPPE